MDKDLVLHRRAWRMLDSLGAVVLMRKFRSNDMKLKSINIIELANVTEKDIRQITPHGDKVVQETLRLRDTIMATISGFNMGMNN